MNVEALVAALSERGIRLIPDGNAVVVKPASKLTDEDRLAIRVNKTALLALLLATNTKKAEQQEIERIGRLDAERNERDRIAGRGYDYEPVPDEPEHVFEQQPDLERWQQPKVDPKVEAEIRRIEHQALALGWSHERLWNAGYWHPWPRGLAAVMDAGDRIVDVTGEHIIIERPRATAAAIRLPFWRKLG